MVDKKSKQSKDSKKELKGIVRVIDKDVEGRVPIRHALSKGHGVSFMMANAICHVLELDPEQKVGYISRAELDKIEDCAKNPSKYDIPSWLFNRRKDIETGKDKHLVSAELDLAKKFDIRFMKKIKTYKGRRHSMGSKKVRGQKTKATGRKSGSLGVKRRKKASKK